MAKTCQKCHTQYTDGVACMCSRECSDPGDVSESPFYGINETGTGLDEPEMVKSGDVEYEFANAPRDAKEVFPWLDEKYKPKPHGGFNITSDGPDHYRRHCIQPIQVIQDWNLGYELGNVLKYISRHDQKGGIKDLNKARDYLNIFIARQGGGDGQL